MMQLLSLHFVPQLRSCKFLKSRLPKGEPLQIAVTLKDLIAVSWESDMLQDPTLGRYIMLHDMTGLSFGGICVFGGLKIDFDAQNGGLSSTWFAFVHRYFRINVHESSPTNTILPRHNYPRISRAP